MNQRQDQEFDDIVSGLTAAGQFETCVVDRFGKALPAFKNTPATLPDYFRLALNFESSEFLVSESARLTYGQAWARAQALAALLQQRYDIKKSDRVAIAMRNSPQWCLSFMAVQLCGAIAVPLNCWWLADEISYALQDCDAALVIADTPRAELIRGCKNNTRPMLLLDKGPNTAVSQLECFYDALKASDEKPRAVDIHADDIATIFYTSGSTAAAKGVVSSHRAIISAIYNFALVGLAHLRREPQTASGVQPAILLCLPLFHITGTVPIFLLSFLFGRKIVMMRKWDAREALRLIAQEKINYFVGVPTMSYELSQAAAKHDFDLSFLTDIHAGGAARPKSHVAQLKQTFPDKHPGIGYGLTETNALGAVNSRASYLAKPESTGRATKPLIELRIADDESESLPAHTVGEIWIRSIANASGYWNKPDETRAAFTPDGWFKTGDLGKLDEQGYLTIVDRKKDIIIRGGENISCLEVEEALYAHETVAEACVFGVADERLGEVVAAVVTLRKDSDIDSLSLRDFVAQKLAHFKVPDRIVVSDTPLPRLGSGKFDRRAIKAKLRSQAA